MPQVPVLPPMRGSDALPEQQRRLGVAHAVEFGLQRQQMPARRRQPRDVLIRVFIAVLGNVLAVETVEIGEYGEHQRQDIPQQT